MTFPLFLFTLKHEAVLQACMVIISDCSNSSQTNPAFKKAYQAIYIDAKQGKERNRKGNAKWGIMNDNSFVKKKKKKSCLFEHDYI